MLETVGSLDTLVGKAQELETALESVVEEIKAEKEAAAAAPAGSAPAEAPVVAEPVEATHDEHAFGLKHPDPSDPNALPPF